MKNKLKLLSLICFIVAVALAIPCVSKAYETEEEVPINYTIKINKIDSASNQNLRGARFQLKSQDGTVVRTETSDEQGMLTFGNIKTFGNGTDIYYIEEIYTPKGYILDEKETIEVDVQKTITNVETGAYKLKISCQTLNYSTDITRYDFVPISSKEDLKKIGSNEEIVYEGKTYICKQNTNYQLVSDIDLGGENWEPIETPISGIFNGDGYKIKNLTMAYSAASGNKEVGLFKSFTGIVQGVNLENVNIVVPAYAPGATSVSGKSGVAAFAAYCGGGTFRDCTVSGTITAGVPNVGGLVGHSAENAIVKFQNCTNNANITAFNNAQSTWDYTTYNVGGLIGCSFSSLSVTDCVNTGTFSGNAGNVGALVGFVKSDGYEETAIKAGYAEDGNTITLLVGNTRTEGEYDLYLEDYDLRTLNILPGGVFTVYDASLTPIEGYENVTLEEGRLKIGTVNIKFEGKDTYFVKDITPVEGYRKIAGYIKVVVTRYWDFDEGRFRVTVDEKVIAEDKIWDEVGSNTEELDSITDSFAPDITFEGVGWNNAKATFVNCTNNGELNGYMNVGGIVGRAMVRVTMDNCNNKAKVGAYSYGKAGGMIGELNYWDRGVISELNNCTNTANIQSFGNNNASAAGMVAQCITDIKLTNCLNTGKIEATGSSASGGMISDATGYTVMDSCTNEGDISTQENGDVDCPAGGMIGNNTAKTYLYGENGNYISELNGYQKTKTKFINCVNTGNITATSHLGGMVGFCDAISLEAQNCRVDSKTADTKVVFNDTYAADKGGIVGYCKVPDVVIKNCNVNNAEFKRTSDMYNNTYGATGGMVGNWLHSGAFSVTLNKLTVENCNVTNSYLETKGQSIAGVVGASFSDDVYDYTTRQTNKVGDVNIENCKVTDCTILNEECAGSTYNCSAGILAYCQDIRKVKIDNCEVKNTNISTVKRSGSSPGDEDAAGVLACFSDGKDIFITNTNVIDCNILNDANAGDSTANASGLIGYAEGNASEGDLYAVLKIDNCLIDGTKVTSVFGGSCGGILGSTKGYYIPWNLSQEEKENIYPIEVTNTTFKNGDLLSTSIQTSNSPISAMIAYASTKVKMVDNTVDNTKVKMNTPNTSSGTNITGFLGMNSYSNMFVNCNISNSELYSKGSYNNLGCVAGIAGYVGADNTFTNCNVTNCTLFGDSQSMYAPSSGNVAGIVGVVYGSATVTGCHVKESTIKSRAYSVTNGKNSTVAGIIGVADYETITDSSVEDTSIEGPGYAIAGVSAIASDNNKLSTLKNVAVKNVDLTDIGFNSPKTGYDFPLRSIGGVVANVGKLSAENITVDDVDVTSHSVTIGGAIGYAQYLEKCESVSVNKFDVTNDPITNGYNGSVAGLIGDVGTVNANSIKGCSVTDSTISTKCHNASGFIGTINSDAKIENGTIDGVSVGNTNETATGSLGNVAGFVSYTSGKLNFTNAKLKNSTLTQSANAQGINSSTSRHVGGLVAYACDEVTIANSELKTNTITNANGGIVGGMVGIIVENSLTTSGDTIEKKLTVSGSEIDTITVTGNSNTGGILGVGNKTTITDTDVSNATVTAGNGAAGIMIGLLYSRDENTVDVSDSDITNSTVTCSGSAGGVIGFCQNDVTASNMNLNKITVTNPSSCAGGIVGACNSKTTATGIKVTNETQITASDNAGGIAGYTNVLDSSNITVNNSKVTSNGSSAGGVVGLVNSTAKSNSVTLNNNTEVSGITHVGGAVGYVGSSAEMKNASVTNIKVTSANENAGGLVAIVSSGNSLDASGANISNIEVKGCVDIGGIAGWAGDITANGITANNVKVTCTDEDGRMGLSGGLFGGSNSISTSNTSLSNTEVSGNHNIGGMIAVGKITANTITLNNITATMNMEDSYAGVGGLIGITNSDSSINGVTANTITLSPKGSLAGGIAGIMKGSISNVNISYVNINANTLPSEVGGIVGELEGTVSSSTVDHANLYGFTSGTNYGDVGGVAGNAAFPGNDINDVHVTNSIIKSDKEVGGIVATTNGNVTNSSVDGCTIEMTGSQTLSSSGGDAGGAVAATAKIVRNVTVTNTTVKSSKLAGGVVGAGISSVSGTTTLENLTVEGNTLIASKTGEYIAVPSLYIVEDPEGPDSTNPNALNPNSLNIPLSNISPLSNAVVNPTSTSLTNAVQGETTSDDEEEKDESKETTSGDIDSDEEQDTEEIKNKEEETTEDSNNETAENTTSSQEDATSQSESLEENNSIEESSSTEGE